MSCLLPKPYTPRKPEESILYQTIRDYYPAFRALCEQDGKGLPDYVKEEFETYLRCGQLYHGFTRRQCEVCRAEHLLPFSCKKRGFCPSCCGRRAAENVVHLVDYLLPYQAYRQWVVTLPINIRYLIASNRALQGELHSEIIQAINQHYVREAQAIGVEVAYPGAITFVQRFGTALNLNIHYHILYLDGVYCRNSKGHLIFRKSSVLGDKELAAVIEDIRARVIALLQRWNYLSSELEYIEISEDKLAELAPSLAAARQASTIHYIALGERAGCPVRRIGRGMGYLEEEARFSSPLCATQNGFSIHAARYVRALDRKGLEQLISYIARPPVAGDRLERKENGELIYRFKRKFSDGTSAILLSPMEFMEKLSALIPTR